jgi:MFS family permease
MTFSFPKIKRGNLPLLSLLSVQLLTGIMLTPLNNFRGIYLNEILHISLGDIAKIIALGQIVGMFASIMSGSLSDRWGHKWMLFMGVSALAISSLVFFVHTPWIVIVLWCISSAGLGLSSVSSQGYLTLASSAGLLGLMSALYNWGYTVGGAVGTPFATSVLGEDNYPMLGIVLGVIGLLALFIISFLPLLHTKRPQQKSDEKSGDYSILLRKEIIILSLLRFLPTCYYGVITLFPILLKQSSGSNTVVAWFVTGSSIFASLTQLLAGAIADRYSVQLPTKVSFVVILIAIIGTIFTGQTVWGLFLFGTLGTGAAWALSTLLPGMVTTVSEPEIRGRVFGILQVVWTIAMMLGTLLGGNLLELDIRLPFIAVGIMNIIALLLTFLFFKLTSQNSPDTP